MGLSPETHAILSAYWKATCQLQTRARQNLSTLKEGTEAGQRPPARLKFEIANTHSLKKASIVSTATLNLNGGGTPEIFSPGPLPRGSNIYLVIDQSPKAKIPSLGLTLNAVFPPSHLRPPCWAIEYTNLKAHKGETQQFTGNGSISLKRDCEGKFTTTIVGNRLYGDPMTLQQIMILIESNLVLFNWAVDILTQELKS